MSDAVVQRSRKVAVRAEAAKPRPIPAGYGLALGASVSLGLWGGIFWLVRQAFG